MPTPAERQALLFVAAVAALGVGARGCRAARAPAPEPAAKAALATQLAQVDSMIAEGGRRRASRTVTGAQRPGPRAGPSPPAAARAERLPASPPPVPSVVDVDIADAIELDRLPGIGPALAARIVADRAERGPFGSLEALQQVRGIGPALAERLRAHVTFSQPPRPLDTGVPGRRRQRP